VNLFLLYLEFFKIGIFAVGGGLATLPFLFLMAHDRSSFIRQTGWLSTEQVGNFLAIAQCSPGAIGVNVAAQTGFQYGSLAGGLLAVLGLVSPAFMVIVIVAKTLQSLKENKIAASVFSGLRPAATGLLCAAGWGVWRLTLYNSAGGLAGSPVWYECIRWREGLICVAIYLLIVKFRCHPVIYIALGAVAGMLLRL
jgi:chromate transporter